MATRLQRTYRRVLEDIGTFSHAVCGTPLRPYQLEPARAIVDSVLHRRGLTFSVMMSRQAGKNELSAQLEAYLLNLFQRRGGNLIKCAPTFNPQILHSRQRLEARLENPLNQGRWSTAFGRSIRLGRAAALFFSADESAHVVGATAHHLLEVDEAQDVDSEKYLKEFRPMGATTNCTTVLYGTPWDSSSLLEQVRAENLALEARDGLRRHFEYPWTVVAEHNPLYRRYVEQEIERLGAEHLIIQTQYLLQSAETLGKLLGDTQLALLAGVYPLLAGPRPGQRYVAGVDVAGAAEAAPSPEHAAEAGRDSTVVAVAELHWAPVADLVDEPRLQVVALYQFTGLDQRDQYQRLVALLREHWHAASVVVDATGVGAGLASFLQAALGKPVLEPYTFTVQSKSKLGYGLLAAANGGRLTLPAERASPEVAECWRQLRLARRALSANQTLAFYVPPSEGHDDFVMALALLVEAARLAPVRRATGRRAGDCTREGLEIGGATATSRCCPTPFKPHPAD
ncbi:MAG: hypothetical protein HY690_10060 [Chloroflexi bacterium]|nr:hypothetical protein [Chloroflexota bacterium]